MPLLPEIPNNFINTQKPVYQRIYRLLTFVGYQKNEILFSAQNIYRETTPQDTPTPLFISFSFER